MFKYYYFMAKYFGKYQYHGLIGWSNLPKARVKYHSGGISRNMEIGTAFNYAEMFGGDVIPPLT